MGSWELWYHEQYPFHLNDEEVMPFLKLPKSAGWLKKARQALLLSTRMVAKKMELDQSTYVRFENGESRLNLATLEKCAAAMDCELVYAIRPKNRKIFSESIRRQLNCDTYKKITRQIYDPIFRKAQGWSQNTEPVARAVAEDLKVMRHLDWNMVRNRE